MVKKNGDKIINFVLLNDKKMTLPPSNEIKKYFPNFSEFFRICFKKYLSCQ